MPSIHAQKALLSDGWRSQVRLTIDESRIARVEPETPPGPEDTNVGYVIPGVPNAHSHAFQRALVGLAEHRGSADQDNFWSWRQHMYQLVSRLDPASLQAIATHVYVQMVAAGYTSVTEFHYLHRDGSGREHADAMLAALIAAASAAGIRLHYVPVFYAYSHFGMQAATWDQRFFVQELETFLDHYAGARRIKDPRLSVGLGAHSLRAVDPDSLAAIIETAMCDGVPFHIHVAEQKAEVREAVKHLGATPVRWLLDKFSPGPNWCLIHATHMSPDETCELAESGAVVCLCPSTEANLGDGLFPLKAYLRAGGSFALGTDSQVCINPFEELRWLEYGQRLYTRTRNASVGISEHSGSRLFTECLKGGAHANGLSLCGLTPGASADLIALDAASATFAGHATETLLDALIFSGFPDPIDSVMVAGRWQLSARVHPAERQATEAYREALERLQETVS